VYFRYVSCSMSGGTVCGSKNGTQKKGISVVSIFVTRLFMFHLKKTRNLSNRNYNLLHKSNVLFSIKNVVKRYFTFAFDIIIASCVRKY
jgi:hypothetical protein